MEKTPLYTALNEYKKKNKISFHTPGHKGKKEWLPKDLDLIGMDLTELEETDSLYEAEGCIKEAEERAAKYFETKGTFFSSGGCTLAIQAMIHMSVNENEKVLIDRKSHRTAVNALSLLGIEPIWLVADEERGEYLPGVISAKAIEKKLNKESGIKAVYITSPDYYGCISDIKGISEVCKSKGVYLLVDNAHGTHLKAFGIHPIQQGADVTACSAHKTLPVLTGGAFLNIGNENLVKKAKSSMALFGSTSPSYPIMATLDLAREWMQEEGTQKYIDLAEDVSELRKIAMSNGFSIPQGKCDPTRLTLNTFSKGYTGEEFAQYLSELGVQAEYADTAHVVMILTPFNTKGDIEKLKEAIKNCENKILTKLPMQLKFDKLPEKKCLPRKAVLGEGEVISSKISKNRVSAQAVCPCPPGIPIIMPGEIIDEKTLEIFDMYGISEIKVIK